MCLSSDDHEEWFFGRVLNQLHGEERFLVFVLTHAHVLSEEQGPGHAVVPACFVLAEGGLNLYQVRLANFGLHLLENMRL